MQTATLRYNPKTNFHSDSKSKFQQRHIFTIIKNPQKKSKQRRSFLSDQNTNSNAYLPPLARTNKRPSSIRIKGSGLQSSKFNDASSSSFQQPPRSSRSRQSDKSDITVTRSRSITPTAGGEKTKSKSVRLRFGYPIKIRSSDFYAPDLTESELRFREESFVNDSILISNQSIRSVKSTNYEPLNDPNLKQFFQSPVVLDVVRRTLNIKLDKKLSDKKKKRSKSSGHNQPYHQIVAKPSSGYGKLNGYDCIPSYALTHHHRSKTHDRFQSADSSLASFPTQQKTKSHLNNKSKQLTGLSSLRHQTATTHGTAAISSVSAN